MASDRALMQEYYFQMYEMQPPTPIYQHYDLRLANSSPVPGYDLTLVGSGLFPEPVSALPVPPTQHPHQLDLSNTKTQSFFEMTGCKPQLSAEEETAMSIAQSMSIAAPMSVGPPMSAAPPMTVALPMTVAPPMSMGPTMTVGPLMSVGPPMSLGHPMSVGHPMSIGHPITVGHPMSVRPPMSVAPSMSVSHSMSVGCPKSTEKTPRKRKYSTVSGGTLDDDGNEDPNRVQSEKKQNHSEIEKRRRDKMNTYIMELSSLVPLCGAMTRKLDKLTVLRMAVQYLRSVSGSLIARPLAPRPRPSFLSEQELNNLILQAAQDCFLLVVGCDRGRLLYVSASVKHMLNYDQTDLLGQSLFDILHPKDVAKVKEQLSSSDLSPRERLIDAKTMLPVMADLSSGGSRFGPGARRSFFCRIKCRPNQLSPNPSTSVKEEAEQAPKMRKKHEKKYCVVQCTGYLKSWTKDSDGEGGPDEGESCNMSCLVAVGRTMNNIDPPPYPRQNPPIRQLQYVSRHTPDGKFLFVDQRVTLVLGFLPQELLGSSLYEYVSGPELTVVAHTHKAALISRESMQTKSYSFRRKNGTLARIQTRFKPFKNPWTQDVECLIANNTVVDEEVAPPSDAAPATFDARQQQADLEMQRLIETQVESHKIGSAIAEEALRRQSLDFSPELPADILPDVIFEDQSSLVDNILDMDEANYTQVRNNVPLSSVGASSPVPSTGDLITGSPPPPPSPLLPPTGGADGNGEATMAVIMSLLEADAGLGGSVSLSGLPWPLP